MVIKPRANAHWISSIVLGYVAFLACFTYGCRTQQFRHRIPGQWLGDAGAFYKIGPMVLIILALIVGLVLFAQFKKSSFAFLMLIGMIPSFFVTAPEPLVRARAEQMAYRSAVTKGSKFGDQYSAELAGRKVVFWRSVTFDLDDGEGVVYDPADRLLQDSRLSLRYGKRKETIFRAVRFAPNLYWVLLS